MNGVPSLSIVIPVFNKERLLPRLLSSLASQGEAFSRVEIILVDDGSHDASFAILREFASGRRNVMALAMGSNSGVHAARNRGMDAAAGEWIAFVDADDYLVEGGLGVALSELAILPSETEVAFFPLETSDTRERTGFIAAGEYDIDAIFGGKVFRPEKGCVGAVRSRLIRGAGIRWYHTNMDFLFWREAEIRAARRKAVFIDRIVGVYDRSTPNSLGKSRRKLGHQLKHARAKFESILAFSERMEGYLLERPAIAAELMAGSMKDYRFIPGKLSYLPKLVSMARKFRFPPRVWLGMAINAIAPARLMGYRLNTGPTGKA